MTALNRGIHEKCSCYRARARIFAFQEASGFDDGTKN